MADLLFSSPVGMIKQMLHCEHNNITYFVTVRSKIHETSRLSFTKLQAFRKLSHNVAYEIL